MNLDNNYENDKYFIKLLKSNDEYEINIGYEGIYNKYSKLVFTCINNIIKNYNDSEDLTADTFLSLFNNRKRLVEEKNIKYYIVTTAKNSAINYLKKKKVDIVENDDIIFEDLQDINNNIYGIIDELKKYLDNEEIKIVFNHLVYALTFDEIAKKLNISENTVKTKYYRALKKIKM